MISFVVAVLAAGGLAVEAGEGTVAKLPAEVSDLAGCWRGRGEVMGKSVDTVLSVRPITLGTHVVIEVASQGVADTADTYAATYWWARPMRVRASLRGCHPILPTVLAGTIPLQARARCRPRGSS